MSEHLTMQAVLAKWEELESKRFGSEQLRATDIAAIFGDWLREQLPTTNIDELEATAREAEEIEEDLEDEDGG